MMKCVVTLLLALVVLTACGKTKTLMYGYSGHHGCSDGRAFTEMTTRLTSAGLKVADISEDRNSFCAYLFDRDTENPLGRQKKLSICVKVENGKMTMVYIIPDVPVAQHQQESLRIKNEIDHYLQDLSVQCRKK